MARRGAYRRRGENFLRLRLVSIDNGDGFGCRAKFRVDKRVAGMHQQIWQGKVEKLDSILELKKCTVSNTSDQSPIKKISASCQEEIHWNAPVCLTYKAKCLWENSNRLDVFPCLENSKPSMEDLPSSGPYRQLPAELNREIYLCFNSTTRRKFIWGLGWNFYAMFHHSLLIQTNRLCNPVGNVWTRSNRNVTISEDGLDVRNNTNGWQNIYAEKGFPICVADCRTDGFPGTICYYYEVKSLSERCVVRLGFLHGGAIFGISLGKPGNTYAIANILSNGLFGKSYELPMGTRLKQNVQGNVFGCGILMDPDNKLTAFFTLNGVLLGKKIPIRTSVDRLFPAISIWEVPTTFETNFGDDKSKPFQYDIRKCPPAWDWAAFELDGKIWVFIT